MEKVVNKAIYVIVMVFGLASFTQAQVTLPPLERPISIEFGGESTKDALKLIENKGQFSFAYRTDLVDPTNHISRAYIDKTVREILDDIFQGTVSYHEKGNYIVLKNSPKLKEEEISLEGYVIDATTGLKVPYTSIYDSITLSSAVSDEYGHYRLKVSKRQDIQLTTRKLGYLDTSFVWIGTGSKVLNIKINPIPVADTTVVVDTMDFFTRLRNLKLFKPSEEQKANIVNFKDNFESSAQFSLIPSVGTNGKLSSAMSVDYSFNLLGGFNGGVRKAEIGGLFNVVWDSVSYFQMAGLFNSVGGPQQGFQAAGLTNINGSSFEGAQFAGLFNFVNGDVRGAQFAGLANSTGSRVNGFQGAGFWNQNIDSSTVVQVAGFGNLTGKATNGAQLAGFVNLAGKDYRGVQAAGFLNMANSGFQGTQLAGFLNVAGKDFNGAQLAGFMNVANSGFKGTQISGFLNIAGKMTGAQIGFVNISDSLSGVPIGFFSFSRKGLHQLEISTNEITPINLAFKSGTNYFYNSFLVGMRFRGADSPYLSAGYGIGSSVRLGNKSRVFFDLQASTLQRRGTEGSTNLLNKLTASYQVQLSKNVAIALGPSFNVYVVGESSTLLGEEMNAIVPYSFYDKSFGNDTRINAWVGGHIALRLF